MGNCASCALPLSGSSPKHSELAAVAATAIFPGGEIRSFYEHITAAELMLERPNCFVVNSKYFQIGQRLSPLGADQELEMGGVYVLLPKKRLNSVVNTADLGALFLAAKRGSTEADDHSSKNSSFQEAHLSGLNSDFEDVENLFSSDVKQMLSRSRSKKPLLETIAE